MSKTEKKPRERLYLQSKKEEIKQGFNIPDGFQLVNQQKATQQVAKKAQEAKKKLKPIERYVDASRNVYIKQYPYKSRATALLFDPFIVKNGKGQFGGQLKDRTGRWAFDRAAIGYRAKQQADTIFQNVGNFILQFKDEGRRLDLFKNALEQRINDAKINVSEYNLEQIAQFFPWLMSCQLLFQPLRSYMFCLANGVSAKYANEVQTTLPSSMINHQVNKAILNAVITNGSLIQDAKAIYSENDIGLMIKGFRTILTGAKHIRDFFSTTVKSLTTGAQKVAQKIRTSAFGEFLTSTKNKIAKYFSMNKTQQVIREQNEDEQAKNVAGAIKFFDELITQIFKEVRAYGQIVVNVNYLRITAQRKIIDGRLMYFYLDKPNLLFSITNSFLTVFEKKDDIIRQLPPSEFTVSYLRKLVQTQVINLGGRMFKNIKDQITMTQQDKQGFKRFSQKFLRWDQKMPKMDEINLKQYRQQPKKKSIKMENLKGKRLDLLQTAYESDYEGRPRKKKKFADQEYENVWADQPQEKPQFKPTQQRYFEYDSTVD